MNIKKKCILITGGAGFIGSHINKMLNYLDYETVILDNLYHGTKESVTAGLFIQGDLKDEALLNHLFSKYKFDAVMHFAAFANVGESLFLPLNYYINNVANTLTLLAVMERYKVKKFVFSSSAAVYGHPVKEKIDESHPCNPITPYGESKWMIEQILQQLTLSNKLQYCAFRYFNASGGDPEGLIKNRKKEEYNLIPRILRSIRDEKTLIINGNDYPTRDGTCIRDFIHLEDLGNAHIKGLEKLFTEDSSFVYNLGSDKGTSIQEVIEMAAQITKKKPLVKIGPRRPKDPPILIANSEEAEKKLNWKIKFSLHEILTHAWMALQ